MYIVCVYHTEFITITFQSFVIVIRLIYRNIRNPNSLSKCVTEPLEDKRMP